MNKECPTPALDTSLMSVERFTIWTPLKTEGVERPLHFSSEDDDLYAEKISRRTLGSVLIQIGIDDGNHDSVIMDAGHSSDLRVLDDAIDRLQRVRDVLTKASPASHEGRCTATGAWGRCKSDDNHQGDCDFPTEADWEATEGRRVKAV